MSGSEVVGFDGAVDVRPVDADDDMPEHVLGAFSEAVVDVEEVGGLEGLEVEAARRSNASASGWGDG